MKLFLLIYLIVHVVLFPIQSSATGLGDAVSFLQSEGSVNPDWSTLGLVAADASSSFTISSETSGSATDLARRSIALSAIGQDPTEVANALVTLQNTNGSIENEQFLNDDIFFVIALRAAGRPMDDPPMNAAGSYIKQFQRPDGGWGTTTLSRSSVDMTAAAVQALASVNDTSGAIDAALAYLKSAQNDDGGFAFSPGGKTNIDSTAWAMHAIASAGQAPASWIKNGQTPIDALLNSQQSDGRFGLSPSAAGAVLTTSYAVIALSEKFLPLSIYLTPTSPDPIPPPAVDPEPLPTVTGPLPQETTEPQAPPPPIDETDVFTQAGLPKLSNEPQVLGTTMTLPEASGQEYDVMRFMYGMSIIFIGMTMVQRLRREV